MVVDPILLYDGDCGFCLARVSFILRHERRRELRFAPLRGPTAAAILARHPAALSRDTVLWVEPGDERGERILARSSAVLAACRYLGGPWRLVALLTIIPRPLRDSVYNLVARHRHRLAPEAICVLPDPSDRTRFLD